MRFSRKNPLFRHIVQQENIRCRQRHFGRVISATAAARRGVAHTNGMAHKENSSKMSPVTARENCGVVRCNDVFVGAVNYKIMYFA